jgi:hypothetical protein
MKSSRQPAEGLIEDRTTTANSSAFAKAVRVVGTTGSYEAGGSSWSRT